MFSLRFRPPLSLATLVKPKKPVFPQKHRFFENVMSVKSRNDNLELPTITTRRSYKYERSFNPKRWLHIEKHAKLKGKSEQNRSKSSVSHENMNCFHGSFNKQWCYS